MAGKTTDSVDGSAMTDLYTTPDCPVTRSTFIVSGLTFPSIRMDTLASALSRYSISQEEQRARDRIVRMYTRVRLALIHIYRTES